MRWTTAAAVALILPGVTEADEPSRRSYETRRATTPPHVDGRVDDPVWESVPWSGDFVQREPAEGVPPTHDTQFKILYDDDAVYFAFRAFDEPGRPTSLLARRDRFPGDWVEVNIDSHLDRRTAFSFTLSLSGTRGDEFISNDGNVWDVTWDPVWEGATHADEQGWTAEMRIPLNQLRFTAAEDQTWGLQVQRRIFRHEERSTWQEIPKGSSGWVSRFGEVRGIRGLAPGRRLELQPYAVVNTERFAAEPGNPFDDGTRHGAAVGLDGKLGVTSNLTIDFTINPDFGQVEADPSQVNLTAFETFFQEKRPFFIEGNSILDLRLAPAITGGHFTRDRLFYSRRIGASPPRSADLAPGEFADQPVRSSILGAAKLSGRTAGGLSIGIVESVTSAETARVGGLGAPRAEAVAPLTNWFAGRVQQDFRGAETQVGAMFTAVHRGIDDPSLRFLPARAFAGGIDFSHYLAGRSFRVEGNVLASRVSGTAEALAGVQTSSARYFQRPDNDHATYDPARTSLAGHAGSLRLTRPANDRPLVFQTGVAWRSPGFEINDLGFMSRAAEINQFGWAAWQLRNPFSVFRRVEINVNEWVDWDFGGQVLRKALNTNAHAHFRNNFRFGMSLTREGERTSNTELRGGPSSVWPGGVEWEVYGNSDQRRRLHAGAGAYGWRGDEDSGGSRTSWTELSYRPTNALTLSVRPSFETNEPEMQYVDTVDDRGADRFVFGRLEQETVALTVRLDLSITPNLTVQYYGSPFVSSGSFSELKRITDPRADRYRDRFRTFDPGQLSSTDGVFAVDDDRDGRADYTFDRPDFDVREFNSTLVARWEYRPGSAVYFVWSQARAEDALRATGGPSFGRGLRELFDAHPHDVLLLKISAWLPL